MKKLLALLLALVMIFSLTACGGDEEKDDAPEEVTTTEAEETTEPAPQYPPVTIGDLTIEYESAVWYDPYGDGYGTMLVYFNITNNGTEAVKPGQKVFAKVLANGKSMNAGMNYQEDVRPELHNSFYNEIAPGETARCLECFSGIYEDGKRVDGVYEITIMDMYHEIPEKLEITIDSATLDVVQDA